MDTEAAVIAIGLVVRPIAAIVSFATGHAHEGWISLAYFVGCTLYAGLLAFEVIDRPWTRQD